MAFSQKTVYALRAVYELSKHHGEGPLSITELAEVQSIPARFLENILIQLKQPGIVQSVRGKDGGYLLARSPDAVRVGDILRAVEGSVCLVSCLAGKTQESCPMRDDCVFLPMWQEAQDAVFAVYDGTSFGDLLRREAQSQERYIAMYSI